MSEYFDNLRLTNISFKTFDPKIDSMIIIYFAYFCFFAYYFFIENKNNTRNKLFKISTSKALLIGLLFVVFLHLYFNTIQAEDNIEKKKITKFKNAIHLGLIASIMALLDRLDIIMGQFFVISFVYYFMGESV